MVPTISEIHWYTRGIYDIRMFKSTLEVKRNEIPFLSIFSNGSYMVFEENISRDELKQAIGKIYLLLEDTTISRTCIIEMYKQLLEEDLLELRDIEKSCFSIRSFLKNLFIYVKNKLKIRMLKKDPNA